MSDSKKGKPVSNLCIEKGQKVKMKPVLQYDLKGNFIKEWESGKKACIFLGFNKRCDTLLPLINFRSNLLVAYTFFMNSNKHYITLA